MRSFLLPLSLLPVMLVSWAAFTAACSCPITPPRSIPLPILSPREQAIVDEFRISSEIYTATVLDVTCKCFANDGDRDELLSCVQYELDDQGAVQRSTQLQYSCRDNRGFGYTFYGCSAITNQTARKNTRCVGIAGCLYINCIACRWSGASACESEKPFPHQYHWPGGLWSEVGHL